MNFDLEPLTSILSPSARGEADTSANVFPTAIASSLPKGEGRMRVPK